ncbi:MAG: glycosyltransferase [Litorimonas sp.]
MTDHADLLSLSLGILGRPVPADRLRNMSDRDLQDLETFVRHQAEAAASPEALSRTRLQLDARLGRILVDAVNRDISLPHAGMALARFAKHDYRKTRALSRLRRMETTLDTASPPELAALYRKHGLAPLNIVVDRIKDVRGADPIEAAAFARSVAQESMTPRQTMFLAFTLYEGGDVRLAGKLIETVEDEHLRSSEIVRKNRILSEKDVLEYGAQPIADAILAELRDADRPAAPASGAEPVLAYVAASTLPFNKVGYATRTHHMVQALGAAARANGGRVVAVARPGYPHDRFDLNSTALMGAAFSDVDEVRYHYLESSVDMQDSLVDYALEAAGRLIGFLSTTGASVVMAASNHVNAFQAYLAARTMGLPFAYEVRGLWEESRASRIAGWEHTERFEVDRTMERFLIENADRAFFITRQVRALFDVPDDRAGLAPNCAVIDSHAHATTPYSGQGRDVLDLLYVGSLVEYEGLDLLFDALASVSDPTRFALRIVGGGRQEAELKTRVSELGLGEVVSFEGRVDPAAVSAFYDSADLVVIPRLPHRVSQLVSPIKPLEAMSYKRVCLVSDVAPMADLFEAGETGYVFRAGDANSLAATLERAYSEQPRFQEIADAAYGFLVEHRDWSALGRDVFEQVVSMVDERDGVDVSSRRSTRAT